MKIYIFLLMVWFSVVFNTCSNKEESSKKTVLLEKNTRSYNMITLHVTISKVEKDPFHRDRLKRWLVFCKVEEVLQGIFPENISEISILLHSPTKFFGETDLINKKYTIDFLSEFNQPYTGKPKIHDKDIN